MHNEKKLLKRELEAKEEQIKSLMVDKGIRLTFKEEWLAKIKNELLAAADTKELRSSFNSLIAQLRLQVDVDKKQLGLQEKIGYNNINFDNKLQKLYPHLTRGEREVCALLRLNLSVKKIMTIRNVSIDSVKSMRHRIRKKMDVSADVELERFIQQLR